MALFRLVEATEGAVFVDDVDISTVGLETMRRAVTIIPQDPVLFTGTVRRNLDMFGDHTDEAIWHALEQAHMKAWCEEYNHEWREDGVYNLDIDPGLPRRAWPG